MSADEWDKGADGIIAVCPLVYAETMIVGGMGIALRLQFARREDQSQKPSGVVQLAMTPDAATELARLLRDAVDRIDQSVPPGMTPS